MVLSEKEQKLEQIKATNTELAKSPETSRKDYRVDGYKNLLNKYGTVQDNTEAYTYSPEGRIPDIELTHNYESNGLFAKIIDTPAEEVVKHDFDLGIEDEEINTLVREAMESLDWEENAADAIRWARLYGGSIAVMMINDGGGLEDPVKWKRVKGIDEILVFERAVVFPDYTTLYSNYGELGGAHSKSKFGMPEYFYVFGINGQFKVHESRLLIFRNGKMPQLGMTQDYRFWGIPEYQRIKRQLRETVTAHGDSVKLLERSVQAIYKMKNLAQLLATDEGEEQALKRLQVIDMARGILNSIAIDSEGEDYGFQTFTLSGIKDVIDSTCNMLSAITEIPQTILFGRSPAGMSATGESDLENYYNFISKLQKLMLKHNLTKLVDVILCAAKNNGRIAEIPHFKVSFLPLWSLSETEQATVDQTKATTAQTKAATAQIYVDMGALDPSEVRAGLKGSEDYVIQDLIDEDTDDDILTPAEKEALLQIKMEALAPKPEQPAMPGMEGSPSGELNPPEENPVQEDEVQVNTDSDDITASAVIVIDEDGNILCGERKDGQGICGPGGHREEGETPEETACRETWEEFGITLEELIPLGVSHANGDKAQIYVSTAFSGSPHTNTQEMQNNRFLKPHELHNADLFEPFSLSLELMVKNRDIINKSNTDGGEGSGNFGHEGVPGQVGGSAPSGKGLNNRMSDAYGTGNYLDVDTTVREILKELPVGSKFTQKDVEYTKTGDNEFTANDRWKSKNNINSIANSTDPSDKSTAPVFKDVTSEQIAEQKVENGELKAEETQAKSSTSEYNGKTSAYVTKETYTSRKAQFEKNAGKTFSDEEVADMVDSITYYTGGDYTDILAAQLDFSGRFENYSSSVLRDENKRKEAKRIADSCERALKYSDKYKGEVKRGLGFDLDGETGDQDGYNSLMKSLTEGNEVSFGTMSSWTTSDRIVEQIHENRYGYDEDCTRSARITMTCVSKTGVDINNMARLNQSEVLFSKDAKFKVKSVKKKHVTEGDIDIEDVYVELEEIT